MLDEQWEDMKSVFVNLLGVPTLTFQMIYDKLESITAESNIGIAEIKQTIRAAGPFFVGDEDGWSWDSIPIREACIFPVRYPDGHLELVSADEEFSIPDRDHWREAFQDQVKMLDFDLLDIHRLKPFFGWLGIGDRYLSESVSETTEISQTECMPLLDPTKSIARKAHALYR